MRRPTGRSSGAPDDPGMTRERKQAACGAEAGRGATASGVGRRGATLSGTDRVWN